MKSVTYRAPAKVILSGEHAVVYGKPALVCGFSLYCTITVHHGKGKKTLDQHLEKVHEIVFSYLQKKNSSLQKQLIRVHISNEIPVGRGLGSSAALSIAFVAALLHFYTGKEAEKDIINSLGYQAEKYFHGNPSGADNTTSCFGGLIFYRKEFEFLKTISALNSKLPKIFEEHLFLIDTGKPAESTAEMVRLVSSLYNDKPEETDHTLYSIEKITKRFVVSVIKEDGGMFRSGIKENGVLLTKLGVMSVKAEQLLASLHTYGVGKITGAGGKQKGSGFLLFFADNPPALKEYLEQQNITHYPFTQDYKGVTQV